MNDNDNYKAFSQGVQDYQDGVEYRLEMATDEEYSHYIRGREYAKKNEKKVVEAPKQESKEEVEEKQDPLSKITWG